MVKDHLFAGEKVTASPLIIGHRGASSHAPENTIAAFRMALEAGAEGLEFDVQLAADGVPVVIHDATLERTALRPESVAALTSKQLAAVDAGSWFNAKNPDRANPVFSREGVPTLRDVLDLCRDFEGLIYIELKVNVPEFAALATAVCDIIRDSPLFPRIIVKSFRMSAIPVVRHSLPEVQTAALFEPSIMTFLRRRRYMIALAREFGAHQISLHYSLVSRQICSLAAEANMPIIIWTADDPKWIIRSRRLGIRSLITNAPERMLAERKRWS